MLNMATVAETVALKPAWCPGCGNFGILRAVNKAIEGLKLEPWQVLMVSGIGQASKLPHYTKANVFNSLHGRAVPPAIGAKLANRELVVIAMGGDGDNYGEGGNHFIHAARRNHDITLLVHDNQVYGLTKGQASPTSDEGYISKTTPYGASPPLNPVLTAIAAGASFVARGFAGDIDHLAGLITAAIRHKGFALVDILQPCVTFNHTNTFQWYKQRVYPLGDSYNPDNKLAALEKAQEWGDKIPTGIFFREERPTYEEQFPALAAEPLVKQPLKPECIASLLTEFI
jgi:2-oxoglutarate ferredoxin oxidoreductase subunit beta